MTSKAVNGVAAMSFSKRGRESAGKGGRGSGFVPRNAHAGFSLLELVIVVAIAVVISAMAVPFARNQIRIYRLNAAASAVASAIQSTRYQAIMVGCPYTLTYTAGSINYQRATQPITGSPPACSATYSADPTSPGGPWATSNEIAINQNTTLQFNPSGTVQATTGSLTFNLTLGTMTKAFTVSGVGNVSIVSK